MKKGGKMGIISVLLIGLVIASMSVIGGIVIKSALEVGKE